MKKILFISIFFLVAWFAYAQTIQVDENTIRQIIDILQKLVKEGQIQIPAPVKVSPEVEKKIEPVPASVIPAPAQLPAGVKPALPESIEAILIPPENIKPVLPDEDREDDVIIQINNLRITRILLNPGIENVKAIFFAVRDTGWKCMLFESEESEKSLPCILDLRKSILQKELAIQITDDTILLQRNRRKAKLEDFNIGDKINVYGFMDEDNNGIDALIVRKIVSAPKPLPSRLPIQHKHKLPSTSTPICIQVITPAYNPQNPLECKEFPTPCDVSPGWIKTEKCPATSTSP